MSGAFRLGGASRFLRILGFFPFAAAAMVDRAWTAFADVERLGQRAVHSLCEASRRERRLQGLVATSEPPRAALLMHSVASDADLVEATLAAAAARTRRALQGARAASEALDDVCRQLPTPSQPAGPAGTSPAGPRAVSPSAPSSADRRRAERRRLRNGPEGGDWYEGSSGSPATPTKAVGSRLAVSADGASAAVAVVVRREATRKRLLLARSSVLHLHCQPETLSIPALEVADRLWSFTGPSRGAESAAAAAAAVLNATRREEVDRLLQLPGHPPPLGLLHQAQPHSNQTD